MIRAFIRMIRARTAGRYLVTPWRSIGWFAVLLVYLFSPIDLIPDYIPFFGIVDDLVLFTFLIRSLGRDTAQFMEWEQSKNAS